MRTLELTWSGVLATLLVFVVAAACIRLGVWQLDRRADRLERNAAIAERMATGRATLRGAPRDTAGLTYRWAEATGRLDHDRSIVLAGRSHNGAPGVHLLTPLVLNNGAVLVNRGWLPAADGSSAELAGLDLPGEVHVEGVLLPFPDLDLDRDRDRAFRTTWFRFDGDAIRSQYAYRVAGLYLLATRPPDVPTTGDTASVPPVVLDAPAPDPGPHLSYAIQWFSFAAILLGGWAVLAVRGGTRERTEPATG